MSKNQYFYYDHETCSFVEVSPDPKKVWLRRGGIGGALLIIAVLLTFVFDGVVPSMEQATLKAENEALQEELIDVRERIESISGELAELSEADEALYRTVFQAERIPDDVRQVGVGGADDGERYNVYGARSASLLRAISRDLDELERKASLQSGSFRELKRLASSHQERMRQMPAIMPTDGPIVSGFGERYHPILQVRRHHPGVDILVDVGTPVYSTGDGVVRKATRNAGYGKYVVIDHPDAGYNTLYAHLSEIPSHIRPGYEVSRGEKIALSGNTGRSTGPHLHYEVRNEDDRPINPTRFFAPSMSPREYHRLVMATEQSTISMD